MKKAIYPGSFDPMTLGHLDIIERSASIFDVLIVGVLNNIAKNTPLFLVEERVNILRESLSHICNVEVISYEGLLVDYTQKHGIDVVVRGLRAISDYEYELQVAQTNKIISGGRLDTLFLTTALEYSCCSSGIVKEIASYNGDVSKFVPEHVAIMMKDKYGQV